MDKQLEMLLVNSERGDKECQSYVRLNSTQIIFLIFRTCYRVFES